MRERLAALGQAMRVPDIRKRILFLFAMFAIYVACAHVPLPGIDKTQLERLFRGAGGLGCWRWASCPTSAPPSSCSF